MFKREIIFYVLLITVGVALADYYTLYTRASGATATLPSAIKLTTGTTVTAPDVISIKVTWEFPVQPRTIGASVYKDLTVC